LIGRRALLLCWRDT